MSVSYRAVQWNRHKRVYDLCIVATVVLFIATFIIANVVLAAPGMRPSDEVLIIRALGLCAILMLHVILVIGPLARMHPWFNVLLYNRRHLGVAMFMVALLHGIVSLLYYAWGGIYANPITSLLANSHNFGSISTMPFQLFGAMALVILFFMAATSHDFWLKNLTPVIWKALHMLVYAAYVLIVAHVLFGALQTGKGVGYAVLLIAGAATLVILHLIAGLHEQRRGLADAPWVDVGSVHEIAESHGKVVCVAGRERVAIFRSEGCLSAVTNVCAHQNGPLGEGRVVDGCITCPWHGYQYRVGTGQSPPPFTEKIATYQLRVEGERILLNPQANGPGVPVEPVTVEGAASDG